MWLTKAGGSSCVTHRVNVSYNASPLMTGLLHFAKLLRDTQPKYMLIYDITLCRIMLQICSFCMPNESFIDIIDKIFGRLERTVFKKKTAGAAVGLGYTVVLHLCYILFCPTAQSNFFSSHHISSTMLVEICPEGLI